MAVNFSGCYVLAFLNTMKNATGFVDWDLTTHKVALYNNTLTPNFSTDVGYGAAPFTSNEVSGTGWAAGGPLFSAAAAGNASLAPTFTESPSGTGMYDMNDVSQATTTLTNARCAIMYANANTNKDAFILITFGADYSTSAGTFTIQWAATGVAAFDVTP